MLLTRVLKKYCPALRRRIASDMDKACPGTLSLRDVLKEDVQRTDILSHGINKMLYLKPATYVLQTSFDSGLFIFRLDMGLKTYNPYLAKNRRWFKDFSLNKAVFNIGLNYPF